MIARDKARVVATGAVGLNIPRKVYYEKEISFINSRSYGPGRYDASYEENGNDYPIGYIRWTEAATFQSVVDLMGSGKLKVQPLISHRFRIEDAATAYEVITGKKKEPFLGVLLTYSEEKMKEERKIVFPSSVLRPQSSVNLVFSVQAYTPMQLCSLLLKIIKILNWSVLLLLADSTRSTQAKSLASNMPHPAKMRLSTTQTSIPSPSLLAMTHMRTWPSKHSKLEKMSS